MVITVRPWREHAELIDLPAQITACGRHAGLVPVERCVALLGGSPRPAGIVARGSFFQRDFIRRQRERGLPLHLIAHEDVIVLRQPERHDRPTASAVSFWRCGMNREPRRPIPHHQPHHDRPDAAARGRVTAPGHLAQTRPGQPDREARARPIGAPAPHNPGVAERATANRDTADRQGERRPSGTGPATATHTRPGGAAARGTGVLAAPQSRRPRHPVHLPRQAPALLPG